MIKIENGIKHYAAYLNNEWKFFNDYLNVYSPIDFSLIAKVSKINSKIANETIEKMYEGKNEIKKLTIQERINLLKKLANKIEENKNELKEILVLNNAKTYLQAESEINACIERLNLIDYDYRKLIGEYLNSNFISNLKDYSAIIKRESYGIVLAIIPFNYPLFDAVNKFAVSFLSGNSTIIKPASSTPLASLHLAMLIDELKFPKFSLSIFILPGKEMNFVLQNEKISSILFTGSYQTGLEILKNCGIKELFFELGGGASAIVLEDANIEDAAEKIVKGIISYSGQRCDAIKLILANEKIYEDLKNLILSKLEKLKIGDPRENVDIVPLIDEQAANLYENAIKDAKEKNCKILIGGKINKNLVKPCLIEANKENVKSLLAFNQEIFSPLAIILKVSNENEAIEISNSRKYGLDACIFTKDLNRAIKIANELEVGAVYINDFPKHGIGFFPFGGRKASGFGRNGIAYLIEKVCAIKSIIINEKS